ncbi:hypothetical protein OCH239_20115 [Roseivivax halodurans JCM 10272]|uniref:Uncharacterized protein n=2 Tax=Roseivivax halodurans TaxID=93683 RepID=X7E6H5_9RHOB|nr:hypothetical protein OCH239_20115 [Roseivivax halodurans JCM 10272]
MWMAAPAAAQHLDVDALIANIDERSGQYRQLTEILQGADAARALAAFDVMLETGDKTMRETAIAAATSATDERLRARALWETLLLKDSFTIEIVTEDLDDDLRTALDTWIGPVSTWGITARFPETQCLNLYRTNVCEESYHLSVSGLKVDMRYSGTLQGSFALNPEGILAGEVMNWNSKTVYPATIQLR